MPLYRFTLAALAVWRITHLVAYENGPWNLLARLRAAGGELMSCFYCLSVWVAAPFALLLASGWGERLLVWPALSAAAILLERLTDRSPAAPAAFYVEDPEESTHVLRSSSEPGAEDSQSRTPERTRV